MLNRDDPHVMAMAAETRGRVVTFGCDPTADVRASDVRIDWPHGTRLVLHLAGISREVRLRLIGQVMVYPFLAAVAVAWVEGRRLDRAVADLEALLPQRGRLQLEPLPGGAWLLRDDLKSSLETIDAALDTLAEIPARRIVVLGSIMEPPGSQRPIYRRLGERIARIADRAILLGSMTRAYTTGAVAAGMPRAAVVEAKHGIRAAWEAVRADLQAGDVVLIKGRPTERLERIGLALQGRLVRCEIDFCNLRLTRCDTCPKLATGWSLR